jgi:hypothetical protein
VRGAQPRRQEIEHGELGADGRGRSELGPAPGSRPRVGERSEVQLRRQDAHARQGRGGQGRTTQPFGRKERQAQHRGRDAHASRNEADEGGLCEHWS